MKKTSLLLAIGALLYGTSGSYALANIYPGMSDAEILDAIKDCPGVATADLTAEEAGAEDAVFDVAAAPLPPPPANIWVDDNDPVHMQEFCGFKPTGGVMANFPVSVNGGVDSATFVPFSLPNSGVAVGNGWLLFQQGDTWDQKWCLVSNGMSITDIKMDPLSRTGPGPEKYAFDIIKDPTHSDEFDGGSQRGWPVVGDTVFTATYSRPVLVDDNPIVTHANELVPGGPYNLKDRWNEVGQDNTHDMYGTLEIKFKKPVSGSVDLPALFTYRADTDCLPVQEVLLNSYDGTTLNFTVVGEGAVAITTTDGSVIQGPFVVERGDGQATFKTQFIPQAGSCYVMTDIDTGTVMTDEHCF